MSEFRTLEGILKEIGMDDKNEGFTDPVLRCDSCTKIVLTKKVLKLGFCNHCGNRRFRNVLNFSFKEAIMMLIAGVPFSFFSKFMVGDLVHSDGTHTPSLF